MNITRENNGNVNAVIKVLIEKQDYEKTVGEKLKEYRQRTSIPGFRPGKAPMGLIRKRVGKAVLAEEINKMLSQNLMRYLVEEKLQVLGEPLPSDDHQKEINWDTDENYEFAFDIGLAPKFEVVVDENDKLTYYNIEVSDEMINQQIDMILSQLGQSVEADEVADECLVRGDFVELDEEGQVKEDGIRAEGVLLTVNLIKNEEIKNQFLGKKKEDTLTFDPVVAYDDRHEVGHLLKISHEQADDLNSTFNFTIKEITRFEKAEVNEELFKKMYGEETDVKTEEEFKNKLREEIAANLKQASDRRFATDVRDMLVEKLNPELPEEFLKRWLRETNKDVTDEQIENDFNGFMIDLRWQLIKDVIIKENELKVEEDDLFDLAKNFAQAQYSQYGIYDAPEEQLESFAKIILEKPEEKERLQNKLLEDKSVEVIKSKVAVEEKEISREEFEKLS